jgi:hypothetical protein
MAQNKQMSMNPIPGGLDRRLTDAWKRYTNLFGEPPHGTERQMAALLELAHLDELEIRQRSRFVVDIRIDPKTGEPVEIHERSKPRRAAKRKK